jgi:hypothetical protein
MKIEIQDELVDEIVASELNNVVDSSYETVERLRAKEQREPFEDEDLEYYEELLAAATIVRRYFTVNQ